MRQKLNFVILYLVTSLLILLFVSECMARDLKLEKKFMDTAISRDASREVKKAYLMQYLELLNNCMEEGDINAAFNLGLRAVIFLPDERIIFANTGVMYMYAGKIDGAITCLTQGLDKKDDIYDGKISSEMIIENALGNCYLLKQKPEESLKHLLKAYNIDKNYTPTTYLLGRAYYHIRDYLNAIKYYDEAFLMNKQEASKQDYLDYATCLEKTGKKDAYIQILTKCSERFK